LTRHQIGHLLARRSGTLEKLSASEPAPFADHGRCCRAIQNGRNGLASQPWSTDCNLAPVRRV